jgi:hypothetical protein
MAKTGAERVAEHRAREKTRLAAAEGQLAEFRRRVPLWQAERDAEKAALEAEVSRLTQMLSSAGEAVCPRHRCAKECPVCYREDHEWD